LLNIAWGHQGRAISYNDVINDTATRPRGTPPEPPASPPILQGLTHQSQGESSIEDVQRRGCAITSMSILLNFFGLNTTHEDIYRHLGTYRNNAPSIANNWGVTLKENVDGATQNQVLARAKQSIDEGLPIAVKFNHDGGSGTHWVVIYGYQGDGTCIFDFLILDPGIRTNAHQENWTLGDTMTRDRYPNSRLDRWVIFDW
jgi:hypothetical protein